MGLSFTIVPLRRSFNLYRANLSGQVIESYDLMDANLEGANLKDVDLFNANLSNAHLFNAKLAGADLSNANLSGQAQLNEACGTPKSLPGNLTAPRPCPDQ
jgi:uncharacterized protein YjbI with pentapeptide repeats